MITKALEDGDPAVFWVVDRDPHDLNARLPPKVGLASRCCSRSGSEPSDVRADVFGEQFEDFTIVGVTARLTLAVEHLTIHHDIEDAGGAGDQTKVLDDMLVVAEQIIRHAHGAIGIVSGNAVGDLDTVSHAHILARSLDDQVEQTRRSGNSVRAIVIYESLTGNTRDAGQLIAAELSASGVETDHSPITEINLQALSEADLVIVGSWTDGLFFFGQRPARAGRLATMPVIDGKKAAVFCTYAIDAGKTLSKLADIVGRRGGDVIGGVAIKRNDLEAGAVDFVDRLLGAIETPAETSS